MAAVVCPCRYVTSAASMALLPLLAPLHSVGKRPVRTDSSAGPLAVVLVCSWFHVSCRTSGPRSSVLESARSVCGRSLVLGPRAHTSICFFVAAQISSHMKLCAIPNDNRCGTVLVDVRAMSAGLVSKPNDRSPGNSDSEATENSQV